MFEPSPLIEALLASVAAQPAAAEGLRAITSRAAEFTDRLQARLTGVALDPASRTVADTFLGTWWDDQQARQDLLGSCDTGREVIIGSGFHAAVYAAVRARNGQPKPLVLERSERVGGTFAMTGRPVFHLNSRTRPGPAGPAGDHDANLNYLPGAPIQASHLSMAEYQTNTDLALVIRLTLAQFADVVTGAQVVSVGGDDNGILIETADGQSLMAGRVIDARGLGDPVNGGIADGTTIMTFGQFMARMATMWPLRGIRRAAVIGGGDSGKCAVESLLGLGPQPYLAAAALDHVDRIDWYSDDLPTSCEQWQQQIRGRYQAIGQYLRSGRYGLQRLTVVPRRATPVELPDGALVDGRMYDLVVWCTGNAETTIDGLDYRAFDEYAIPGGGVVARRHVGQPVFRVGPHARLPFTYAERQDGVADNPGNAVAMFRTSGKTAALAATLPQLRD
jgi:hypothetical protein